MKNVQLNNLKKQALIGNTAKLILLLSSSGYKDAAEKKKEKKVACWEVVCSLQEQGEGETTFCTPAHNS